MACFWDFGGGIKSHKPNRQLMPSWFLKDPNPSHQWACFLRFAGLREYRANIFQAGRRVHSEYGPSNCGCVFSVLFWLLRRNEQAWQLSFEDCRWWLWGLVSVRAWPGNLAFFVIRCCDVLQPCSCCLHAPILKWHFQARAPKHGLVFGFLLNRNVSCRS